MKSVNTKLRGEKQEGNTLRDVTNSYFLQKQSFIAVLKY